MGRSFSRDIQLKSVVMDSGLALRAPRNDVWRGLIRIFLLSLLPPSAATAAPETVTFRSADGVTAIVGYLFRPAGPGPHPAIVLLHGRGGPYSTNDNATCTLVAPGVASPCNATTLSKRHLMWGSGDDGGTLHLTRCIVS
jgi:hypothetical protein